MALLSTVRDLHRRKARERRHLALAEGIRVVEEMLRSRVLCKGAVVSPALRHSERGVAVERGLLAAGVEIAQVNDDEFGGLAATEHPQGVLAVYQPREWSSDQLTPALRHPLVVLDAVQDPGNVGTIARTALAFGARGLLALPGTADLTSPKVVRSAAGALFSLPNRPATDIEVREIAARASADIWVTDVVGESLYGLASSAPLVIIVGNEGAGVRPEWMTGGVRRVAIPMVIDTESLNVAVSSGIVLSQVTR